MDNHKYLKISNHLDILFSKIGYSGFHLHTSKLLKKAINDSKLSLPKALSSRFLIWDSNNKGKKYKKELPLLFPESFSDNDTKQKAAEFLVYIKLSQEIVNFFKTKTRDGLYSGLVRNVAEKSIPSIFCCKGDKDYKKRLDSTLYQYFPSIIKSNDNQFKKNLLLFKSLIPSAKSQINNPSKCELENVNLDNSIVTSIVDYIINANSFDVEIKENVEKKYHEWYGITSQMLLLEMWLLTTHNSSGNKHHELWVFPSPSNIMDSKKADYHGAVWMLPQEYNPGDFYVWQMVTKEIFLRGFWSEKVQETFKHGTKAAMTAIMSRNISHNIGSHVISYWNTELQEKLKSKESTDADYSKEEEFIKTSKELFQYIQHRQDFVAELATSIPCSEMSLDLENDIFGPFIAPNIDKYRDGNDSNSEKCISAMLGYIAKSEDINMHKKIGLKTTGLTNTRASIPNGLVGVHAVYSILENFIRNAAKHCKRSIKVDEEMVRIDVNEPVEECWKDDYLAVTLWDWREESCEKKTIESYKKFLPGGKECLFSDSDGNLKPGGWGIKEMLTSANFLRKKTPEDLYKYINNLDKNNNEPLLLEAICDDHNNCKNNKNCSRNGPEDIYKGKFGIRFYLRKPKDLAVVLNKDGKKSDFTFNVNGLVKNSIFAIKQFDNYEDHVEEISSYNMVLVEKVEESKLSDNPSLPCRIMPLNNSKVGNGTDSNTRYLDLYESFIKYTFGYKNAKLPVPYCESWSLSVLEEKIMEHFSYNKTNNQGAFAFHLTNKEHVKKYVRRLLNGEYIQPISGGYSTKTKLKSIKNIKAQEIQRQVLLELVEAVFVEVIIVDERISDLANKEYTKVEVDNNEGEEFKRLKKNNKYVVYNKDILREMKIHVIDVDKENIKYSDLAGKLKKWLKAEDHSKNKKNGNAETNGEQLKPPAFFVIHQGVLDKLRDENKTKRYDTTIMNNVNCRWQVIDSGRGVPEKEKLEEYPKARFVQISALQKLLENFDKHGLAQTLFSTRRPQF